MYAYNSKKQAAGAKLLVPAAEKALNCRAFDRRVRCYLGGICAQKCRTVIPPQLAEMRHIIIYYLELPEKNTAMVPGPACAPITAPMSTTISTGSLYLSAIILLRVLTSCMQSAWQM